MFCGSSFCITLIHRFSCFYPLVEMFFKNVNSSQENICDIRNWLTFPSFSWNNDIFSLWCSHLTPQEILLPSHFHLFPGLKINDSWSPLDLHKSQSNLLRDACDRQLQLESKGQSEISILLTTRSNRGRVIQTLHSLFLLIQSMAHRGCWETWISLISGTTRSMCYRYQVLCPSLEELGLLENKFL